MAALAGVQCSWGTKTYEEGETRVDGDGNIWQCQSENGNAIWVKVVPNIWPSMRQLKSQSPGLCIGVSGSSQAEGANVVQGGCVSGNTSQAWAQIGVYGYGAYGWLINEHSGLCINVNGSGLLYQDTCTTLNTNQFWRKYTSGSYWKFQNYVSGQVITVPGGYNIGGLQLGQYPDLNLSYQKWSILPIV